MCYIRENVKQSSHISFVIFLENMISSSRRKFTQCWSSLGTMSPMTSGKKRLKVHICIATVHNWRYTCFFNQKTVTCMHACKGSYTIEISICICLKTKQAY